MKRMLLIVWVSVAGLMSAQAVQIASYNGDYVTVTTNCQGLSGGQVPWSMTSPRSPASGYTGPVYYGGLSATEAIAQWRIVQATPLDYILTQDASAAAGSYLYQVVMFTNEIALAWTGAVMKVAGYDVTGTTNWFRLVAQDAADNGLYISDPVYYSSTAGQSFTQYPAVVQWNEYDPASSIAGIGDQISWTPDNVISVGIFQGSENTDSVAQGIGSKLYMFEATGKAPTGTCSLAVSPNNSAWGSISPTGGVYSLGTSVQITATASNHYYFSHWSGDLSGTNSPVAVTMYANKTVQANFAPAKHTLTVVSPHGTPVPAGIVTNGYGTALTNTVNSPVFSGMTQYTCTGWTMTGNNPVSGENNVCGMTVTNNAVLTWQWVTNLVTIPAIGFGPASLSFQFTPGGTAPAAQSFIVTNVGLGSLHVSNSWNFSWLDVQPRSAAGLTNGQTVSFTVSIITSNLSLGRSNDVITITSTNANNAPQTLAVQLDVSEEAAPGDWPVYGKDAQRSSRTDVSPVFPLAKAWVYKLKEPTPLHTRISTEDQQNTSQLFPIQYDLAPSTIIVGNRAYLCSSTEEAVLCLDAVTGTNIWTFHAEGAVRLAPAYNNGKIYFGADDGYAYCLNAANGALVWKTAAATNAPRRAIINSKISSVWPVRTGVAVENDKVYFGGGSMPVQGSYLCCADANDGSIKWRKSVPYLLQGYILVSSNELYVGTGRTVPMQYSKTDGTPVSATLKYRREGGGTGLSMINGDWLVYGPSENGVSYIRISRTPISAYSTSAEPQRIPGEMIPIAAQRVLLDGERFYFLHNLDQNGSFVRPASLLAVPFAAATNALFTSAINFDSRYPTTVVDGKSVYWHYGYSKIGARHSEPLLFKEMTNASAWQITNAPVKAGLLTPNAAIVGGLNIVSAYNPTNGVRLWTAAVTGVVYELSLANGTLIAGTDAGYVYCFSNGASGTVNESAPLYASPYPTNDANYSLYAEAASLAITNADTTSGYCLVLGAGEGRLAYEIAKRSNFMVIGLETDSAKAAAARAKLMQAGVYGSRVVIHEDMDELFPHPDYFANLIVSEELLMNGAMPYSSREIFRMLQPYGGTVLFGNRDGNLDVSSWAASDLAMSAFSSVSSGQGITWKIARRGEPSGFGRWSHQLADPGNSQCSGDERVKSVFQLQWINELNPEYMLDRHAIPGSPMADQGRLFIVGLDYLTAVDAYNGIKLWEKPLNKILRQVAMLDAPLACVANDALYVASSNTCRIFNAQTGADLYAYQGPLSAYDWGYVAVYSNILFGSNQKTGASVRVGASPALLYEPYAVAARTVIGFNLFAKNPSNGTTLWNYTNGAILNSSITIGGTNIFFAVSRNSTAMNDADGRGHLFDFFASDAYLVALDINTGNTAWEQPLGLWAGSNREQAFFLTYAENRLVQVGTSWAVMGTAANAAYEVILRDAASGSQVGSVKTITGGAGGANTTDHNGTLMRPFITMGKAWLRTYTSRTLHSFVLSNAQYSTSTFTGPSGTKGCAPPSASKDTFYYRGYSIEGASLITGVGVDLTTVTRPSCWPNILPVGGVLLMPEGSAGCSCGMAEQLSMGLAPYYTDTQAPSLFNVVATNATTVIVVFNEAVSPATAENKANYGITMGTNIITVSSAVRQTNHLDRVTLTVSTLPGGTNTLAVSGVKDLHNNAMSSQQMNFEFGAADADSDGLPDSWEQQIIDADPGDVIDSVEDVLPGDDFDTDGLSNWEEYIAGTDPTSAFSSLRVESIIPAVGSSYVVTWTPQSGRTYNVLWTDKLTTNFTTLTTGIAYPQSRWTDTLHGASAEGFYRIEAVK